MWLQLKTAKNVELHPVGQLVISFLPGNWISFSVPLQDLLNLATKQCTFANTLTNGNVSNFHCHKLGLWAKKLVLLKWQESILQFLLLKLSNVFFSIFIHFARDHPRHHICFPQNHFWLVTWTMNLKYLYQQGHQHLSIHYLFHLPHPKGCSSDL